MHFIFVEMDALYSTGYESPIGWMKLTCTNQGLCGAHFSDEITSHDTHALLSDTIIQLDEYFQQKRTEFSIPMHLNGTDFQLKIWGLLLQIRFGKTMSYLQMARLAGDEKVIRAAASANGKNPLAIIVPCHRVIGADGSLTGYAGGLWRKKWLLEHEYIKAKQGTFSF
jgi:methylated-DNA-[protein]-cysteine S-methyltransferase